MELTKSAQNMFLRLWIELTKSAQNTVLRLWIELTKSVTYIYSKVKLTWFEEIFEEYKLDPNKLISESNLYKKMSISNYENAHFLGLYSHIFILNENQRAN